MKKIKIMIIGMFWGCLLIPIIFFNWKENVVSEIDNRQLTNNPFGPNYVSSENSDMTNAIESYVQDRMGFRDNMIKAYTQLNDKLFHEMVHPSYTYGKDDYVFFKIDRSPEFTEYHVAFANMIEQIQQYCEDRGVPFVFVFEPSKTTVLQNKLPEGINYNTEWVTKFLEELDKREINYVDNTKTMEEKIKNGEEVFNQKYNAGHWNDLGAFYGVNAILEKLKVDFSGISVNHIEDFDIKEQLNTSLPVSDFPIYEYEPIINPLCSVENITEQYSSIEIDNQNRYFQYKINDEKKSNGSPKTLVFQGSYMNGMGYKFFENSLGEYIAVHDYQNIINFDYYFNIFKPECVIFEVAEYTVNDNYFDYENMQKISFNPPLNIEENSSIVEKQLQSEQVEFQKEKALTKIHFKNTEANVKNAYLKIGQEVFDFRENKEKENEYFVTIETEKEDRDNMEIILVKDDGEKIAYKF